MHVCRVRFVDVLVYPIVLCVPTEAVSCAARTQSLCTPLEHSATNNIHNFVA
jgi:hypothetical protein